MKLFKKSFAKRRKIINNIPSGSYCYAPIGYKGGVFYIETCPYWKSIGKDRAKCKLYNIKDKYPQDLTLLWDQCKICNLKLEQ
jgi:hypothetical protein